MKRTLVILWPQVNHSSPGFIEAIGQPQVLQLNIAAHKLFVKLRERLIKALQQF